MKIFCQMLGNLNLGMYLCTAKKGRDGLCHQRTKTRTGHRTQPEFAKKETLRIVPQQVLAMQLDTVQLTYPLCIGLFLEYHSVRQLQKFFYRFLFFQQD
jgi:hypothetical protein